MGDPECWGSTVHHNSGNASHQGTGLNAGEVSVCVEEVVVVWDMSGGCIMKGVRGIGMIV